MEPCNAGEEGGSIRAAVSVCQKFEQRLSHTQTCLFIYLLPAEDNVLQGASILGNGPVQHLR